MSDNENRRFNSLSSGGGRSRGQLFLVFLVATLLIISVAAVALAEDIALRAGEPASAEAVYSAEELQYRKILQGIARSPDDVDQGIGCLEDQWNAHKGPPTQTLNCSSKDVNLGAVTGISVQDGCDGLDDKPEIGIQDYITFTADFRAVSGASERYDIGLWISTDGTGNVISGTECAAASYTIGSPNPPWAQQLETKLPDACGDASSAQGYVEESFQFSVKCDAIVDGVFDLPYCTAWNNADATNWAECNTASQAVPRNGAKCNCDQDYVLNNEMTLVKTSIPAVMTASPDWPEFKYQLLATNSGPITATQILITDTLPIELKYDGSATWTSSTGQSGVCSHDGSAANGVVTCDTGGGYLPDLPESGQITVTIAVEIADPPVLPDTEIYNYACVTWYGIVDGAPARLSDCDDDTQVVGPTAVTLQTFTASNQAALWVGLLLIVLLVALSSGLILWRRGM